MSREKKATPKEKEKCWKKKKQCEKNVQPS
jgi:hypothetical protein